MGIDRDSLKELVADVTVKLADAIDGAVEDERGRVGVENLKSYVETAIRIVRREEYGPLPYGDFFVTQCQPIL